MSADGEAALRRACQERGIAALAVGESAISEDIYTIYLGSYPIASRDVEVGWVVRDR